MASSNRDPIGYRRTDPDETPGRLLYRQLADTEARRSLGLARKVSIRDGAPNHTSAKQGGGEGE